MEIKKLPKEQVTIRLPVELYEELKIMSIKTGIGISNLVLIAIVYAESSP